MTSRATAANAVGLGGMLFLLLALLLPLAAARHVHHIRTGRWRPHQTVFMAVLAGVFAAAVITLRDRPALLVVLAASSAVYTVMWRRARLRPYLDRLFAHMGVVGWAAFLALGGLTDTVWVPEQRSGLRDGTAVTGYVMNVQSPHTEVLTEDGRNIRELLSADVASRTDTGE
ncbi:MAG TPA: hypothetical protein VFV01_21890 [Spirillospora sp.]|nr:hypothetical protein [Spirillospora sp.]